MSISQFQETAAVIRARSRYAAKIALVLGSGLSPLADAIEEPDVIPYADLPNWPISTVKGHAGQLVLGKLEGKTILVQQGRAHFYEGYEMGQLTFPVRVMQQLGVQTLILTNAAGGINPNFTPGDLMLIRDHINFPGMAGQNPLRGPNDEALGPRFPDMIGTYDADLRATAKRIAAAESIPLHEGVYAYVAGPSFETPAELFMLRAGGADAVGMSTVPTAVVARHAGIRTLGISSITNMAVPDPAPGTELTHSEVMEMGKLIVPRLITLLRGLLRALP
jgi:purine-nucleoside phosphorylase